MLVRSSKESSHSTTSLDVEGKILQNQTSLMPPSGGPKPNSGPTNSGNQQGTKVLVGIVVVFLVCHIGRLVIQVSLPFFIKKREKLTIPHQTGGGQLRRHPPHTAELSTLPRFSPSNGGLL